LKAACDHLLSPSLFVQFGLAIAGITIVTIAATQLPGAACLVSRSDARAAIRAAAFAFR
jgi:hypothetical protein